MRHLINTPLLYRDVYIVGGSHVPGTPEQCYFCDWNHVQALACQIIKTPQWNDRNFSATILFLLVTNLQGIPRINMRVIINWNTH